MTAPLDLAVIDPRLAGIRRPATSGPTSGLCRALADRFGVDPLVVRLATLVLTFAAGLGLALYVWGTLLTPRVGQSAPIQNLVPAFSRWPRVTQLLTIGISSLALTVALAWSTGLPVGPAVLLLVLVWLVRRDGTRAQSTRPARWAQPAFPATPDPAGTSEPTVVPPVTVEAWRQRLAAHATSPAHQADLPVVDLYGAEPPANRPSARPRVSWAAAGAVVLLALGAAVIPVVEGREPMALWMLAAATGTLGVSFVAYSLFLRSSRLPGALLVVSLLLGALTTGAALSQSFTLRSEAVEEEVPVFTLDDQGWPSEDTFTQDDRSWPTEYTFMAEDAALVDLTQVSLDVPLTIHIDAVASTVRVLLPGAPADVQHHRMIASEVVEDADPVPDGTYPPSRITLVIDATASQITLEYPS